MNISRDNLRITFAVMKCDGQKQLVEERSLFLSQSHVAISSSSNTVRAGIQVGQEAGGRS